jgi:transcriptional antiterminator NusG
MMIGEIGRARKQWYAVRMKQTHNRGRRTTVVGGQYEIYRGKGGVKKKRRLRDTGQRVFVPEHILRRAGFDTFLPLRKEYRRKNRFSPEKVLVAYPLLGDWLFVGWDAGEPRWHQLMDLDVVAGVMATGGRPVQIAETQVKALMRQFGGGKLSPECYRYMKTGAEFHVGDTVRAVDGPLDGHELRVVEISGPSVRAVLDILGGSTEIEIGADVLEAVR